ncbi:unnamed protein product, partial [Brachionus calyciflorus]
VIVLINNKPRKEKLIKVEDRILETKFTRRRFAITIEKDTSMFPAMENQLYNWIQEKRKTGCCITGNSIRSNLQNYMPEYR